MLSTATALLNGVTWRSDGGRGVRRLYDHSTRLRVASAVDAPVVGLVDKSSSPGMIRSSTNAEDLTAAPIGDDDADENKELSTLERAGRSLKFYSNAIPIFAAYKLLDAQLKLNEELLGEKLTDVEKDEKFKGLHEWAAQSLEMS
jgi:hypothetical protein